MAEKNSVLMKGTVLHKRKTEADWYKDVYDDNDNLRANPYIPKNGQIIAFISEDEETGDKLKVGDGVRNVMELPFSSAGSGGGGSEGEGYKSIQFQDGIANGDYSISAGTDDKSVIQPIFGNLTNYISIEVPRADGIGSIAVGGGTEATNGGMITIGSLNRGGVKGYYWRNITFNSDGTATIKLSTNRNKDEWNTSNFDWHYKGESKGFLQGSWEGDMISIVNDAKYPVCGRIVGINNSTHEITVDSLPFTEIKEPSNTMPDDYTVYACYKKNMLSGAASIVVTHERWYPRGGEVEIGWAGVALGVENLLSGSVGFVAGWNNWQAGDFGAVFGRDNIGGYASLVAGSNNNNNGTNSIVGGTSNIVTSSQSIVGGSGNDVQSGNALVGGANHSITNGSSCAVVAGDTNILTKSWCTAIFGNKNTNSGSFSLVSGQSNTITNSNGVAVSGISNTIGANNVVVGGTGNTVAGANALVGGSNNNVTGGSTIVGGSSNTIENGNAAVFGANHSVTDNSSCVIVAGDTNTLTKAWCSAVFGNNNTVTGNFALVAGTNNNVSQHCTIVAGEKNVANGNDSAIFGENNKSAGAQTLMCSLNGVIATSCGQNAMFGENNIIGSDTAITLPSGKKETKSGIIDSIIAGKNNKIYASYSIAGGQSNTIWNGNSAVFGYDNSVQGASTLIAGDHNIANTYCQTVVGIYNDNTVTSGDLFVVGNGSSSKRNNAFRVTSSGSARIATCTGESQDEVVNVGYLKNYLLDKEW